MNKERFLFKDRLIKGISDKGNFRISVVKTTEVVRTARERHNLSLLNTVLLGRTLTAAMLLASDLKGEERLRLRMEGSGPVGMLVGEANRAGEIRGYASHASAELDYSDPLVKMGDGLGAGLLTVSKTLYNEAEPRHSTIELARGDVTADVAHYLARSEQIPSAIRLDVELDTEGEVRNAAGLLLQRLPGANETVIESLQKRLETFGSVATRLDERIYIDRIMKQAAGSFRVRELERQPVHFFCRCSRERFLAALSMLHYDDLREMEQESQEIVCHFCGDKVRLTADEMKELVSGVRARMN